MSRAAIELEHVSKRYRLGERTGSYVTLRETLSLLVHHRLRTPREGVE